MSVSLLPMPCQNDTATVVAHTATTKRAMPTAICTDQRSRSGGARLGVAATGASLALWHANADSRHATRRGTRRKRPTVPNASLRTTR